MIKLLKIFRDLIEHRLELLDVVAILCDLGGDNELILVSDRLAVVSLDPAFPGLHDSAVGIRDVSFLLVAPRFGIRLIVL